MRRLSPRPFGVAAARARLRRQASSTTCFEVVCVVLPCIRTLGAATVATGVLKQLLMDPARRTLLDIAREAVRAAAEGREPAPPPQPLPPELEAPGAAFVTLRRGHDLRGCIGHLAASQPLWRSVQEMAAAAATRDDRFDPVRPEETAGLRIEISVLSPRRPIAGPGDVKAGVDGLYVRLGPASGLLLPQVAAEQGWSPEEFIAQVCRKADLPPDAWRDPGASLESFTAEVFGEE